MKPNQISKRIFYVLPTRRRAGVVVRAAVLVAWLVATHSLLAQPSTLGTTGTNAPAKLKFNRPSTGAPTVRLTGGSRGAGDSTVTLDVLAPAEVGLTTQEQPSLFWYQSKPSKAKFEVTLLQDNQVKPMLQVTAENAMQSGIHRVRLSDHGVKLMPGVEYQWVVALVSDPQNRSSDLVASGMIKRIEPDASLKGRIATAVPATLPGVYADAGVWYDALAAISDQIDANPADKSLRQSRADLLRQGGLKGEAVTSLAGE